MSDLRDPRHRDRRGTLRRLGFHSNEAKILASLNHRNIASLHEFDRQGDTDYIVMELVEGETLAERIKRGAIPVEQALALFLQIAEGLGAAHEKGVIHRDLKPANIKVADDGGVKILDFGLGKAIAEGAPVASSSSRTLTLIATSGLNGFVPAATSTLSKTPSPSVSGSVGSVASPESPGKPGRILSAPPNSHIGLKHQGQ